MARLTLSLFGPFHVMLDNRTVDSFGYDKVRALLAYLVMEADRPHRREVLAELLWPDQPATTARHSLSQALTRLRQVLGDHTATTPYLLTTRPSVQWNRASDYAADVASFTTIINSCQRHAHGQRETCVSCAQQLEQAVALYKGEFLAQFAIGDSAAFEEWTLLRREGLQQRALSALSWLSHYHAQRGMYDQAAQYTQTEIALDPWREDAHRRLMQVLALSNQRAAALRHYEQCRRLLAAELGIEPDAATTALYEQIRAGELVGEDVAPRPNHRVPASNMLPADLSRGLHNLPAPTTAFIGREHEIATIDGLLAHPECRLITLVGPGGIGKTRLSQHVAHKAVATFVHGVYLVPLAPVRSARGIVAAIAGALHLQFFGQDDPTAQLLAYLRGKQMLIVLDNVEHLLDGTAIISDLLQAAPAVKLLATSRERLNLHCEWVYQVEGLSVPPPDTVDKLERYSAVQLFVQSARRTQSRFELHTDDHRWVGHICRLAGGTPLVIELAAAWVPVLTCAEIAREIEKNLDFLAASTHDLPARHRSVRAVFDHSWNLLSERERLIFRRLSIFRGGLTRAAAQRVADASLTGLAALVAKSLLHRTAAGRYEIHELLRQYGADKLSNIAGEAQHMRARHAAFYVEFLAQCAIRLKGRDQQNAIREIIAEMENIRDAWNWATEQHDLALIERAFEGLWLFFACHGNVGESGTLFDQAITCLEGMTELSPPLLNMRDLLLAKLYSGLAPMQYRLGHVQRARSLLEQSLTILRRIHAPRDLAFALHHGAAALHLQGAYGEEQALLRQSIALSEAEGDQWLAGYSRNDLGLCTHLLGDDHAAQRSCAESLAIFERLDDRRGIAFALHNLGVIGAAQGNYGDAERLHRESLALRRAIDDRWGIAMSLTQLGVAMSAAGQYTAARRTFLDALRVAHDIRALPVALDILVALAQVLISEGETAQARPLLGAALEHPALTPQTRHKLESLLVEAPLIDRRFLNQSAFASIDPLITRLLTSAAVEAIPA